MDGGRVFGVGKGVVVGGRARGEGSWKARWGWGRVTVDCVRVWRRERG